MYTTPTNEITNIETLSFYATITTMKKILFIVTLFFLISSTPLSYANDDWQERAKEKAQKAIDACWAISLEDRSSPVTAKMRAGNLNTALCMEKHIVELSETYLFIDDAEKIQRVKDDLEQFRSGYGHFMWMLYNESDLCPRGWCGTYYHVIHNTAYAKQLETVVFDVYRHIEGYKSGAY